MWGKKGRRANRRLAAREGENEGEGVRQEPNLKKIRVRVSKAGEPPSLDKVIIFHTLFYQIRDNENKIIYGISLFLRKVGLFYIYIYVHHAAFKIISLNKNKIRHFLSNLILSFV